jgi:hypothetical protein
MTHPTYDKWIAIGLANVYIDKRFVGQFSYIIENFLKEYYEDSAKRIRAIAEPKLVIEPVDAVSAFTNDIKRMLPNLSSPVISQLPSLIPSPHIPITPPMKPMMQSMNANAEPYYAKPMHKPFQIMTHEEKREYFKCPPDGNHGVCPNWLKGNYCDRRCILRHSIYMGFKSRICPRWTQGRCPFEDIKCGFAHGEDDIFNRETMTTKYSARKIVFNKYEDQKEMENLENMMWQHFHEMNASN